MKKLGVECGKNKKGITLVALIVTIVVLLILAGVSLNLLVGNNGIITRAKQAKISNDLSSYKEQLAMFIAEKKVENPEFYESSLTAGKNNLYYNTKTSEDEKTIKDIINDVKDEYLDSLEVIKGKLIINTQDKNIIKVAQAVGVEPNPYVIKDGELMSNDGNLLLVDENGTLTLPDSVTKIGEGAFSNVDGLKTIIIPGTVKIIGQNAFTNNKTLEKVVIEEGTTTIEASAFSGCTNLSEVILPESIKNIATQAFYSCRKLDNIEIPKEIQIISMYCFCNTALTNVKFNGENVTRIEDSAFANTKINKISIAKNVNYIGTDAFGGCTELNEIDIDSNNQNYIYENGILMPKTKDNILFVSSKYYKDNNTFIIPEGIINFNCNIASLENIEKLVIPASTKNIMVANLPKNITIVTIAEENEKYKVSEDCIYTKTSPETLVYCYSKASKISLEEPAEIIGEYSFWGAKNATTIKLNDATKKILTQAFVRAEKLTNIEMGKEINEIDPMFTLWKYNVNVSIDKQNPNYIIDNGVLYSKNKEKIITVLYQIKGKFDFIYSVKNIGEYAFYSQSAMTQINLNNTEEIGKTAFYNCTSLKEIEIPNTIKTIHSEAFSGANSTSKIKIKRKENAISGSPFGSPFGLRAIEWVGDN